MPESAEEVYARFQAAAAASDRLPLPPSSSWETFPWQVVDGELAAKALAAPADEAPRFGEQGEPCRTCAEIVDADRTVWEDEHWVLTHPGAPSGLPIVLLLNTREHQDFGELDDDLASEMGRITNRLVRIIEHLPNIGRAHVSRWGDGGAHLHTWFFGRTERLTSIRGSFAVDWDEILPPGPEDIWRADLHTVAAKLANWGGEARA